MRENLIANDAAEGVTKISQYYHHETVLFNGKEDVRSNVRNDMSTKAGMIATRPQTPISFHLILRHPTKLILPPKWSILVKARSWLDLAKRSIRLE